MADLTVIALAEFSDGETKSFGERVTQVDIEPDEFETEIGESLIEAGEMMVADEDSINTVEEFRDWAHEEIGDAGTIVWTSSGADNIPEGEEYCHSAFGEEWDGVEVPDGWAKEPSDFSGINFRKEANVTTIDPDEWYVAGFSETSLLSGNEDNVTAVVNNSRYYFSQDPDEISAAIVNQVSEGFGGTTTDELVDALEDNL